MRTHRGDTGRWLSPQVATLGRWTKPYWSALQSSWDDYSLRVLMRRSDDGEWQLLTSPAALTYASTLGVFRGEPWCFETWSPGSPPERHLVAAAGQVSPEDWDRQLLGFNGKIRASLRALRVDRPLAQVRLQRVLPLRMRVRPKVGLLAAHTGVVTGYRISEWSTGKVHEVTCSELCSMGWFRADELEEVT